MGFVMRVCVCVNTYQEEPISQREKTSGRRSSVRVYMYMNEVLVRTSFGRHVRATIDPLLYNLPECCDRVC
jgi:hypothetical protein